MAIAVMDLLPRDAELARRAAGGDGAAFVRLYDHYSTEVFATALAATGSVDAAAEATQTAFLRILRWPPALGAPDDDVVVRGDVDAREFIAFWHRDGVVTAAMNVNVWDVVEDLKGIVAAGRPVDLGRLADQSLALTEVLGSGPR
jgi:hypothetical protein